MTIKRAAFATAVTGALALSSAFALPVDEDALPPKGDPERGMLMATEMCSRCHAVGRTGDSPVSDAPPFRIFSQLWPLEYLEESLAEGITVGHPIHQMPVFQFTPGEIADLLAYMDSIQAPKEDD